MLDLIIVLSFVIYAIYSGFKSQEVAGKDLKEYFLAGKSLKGWKAGVSMAATQFAADTPLLVTGLIATGGVFTLWRLWVYGISFLLLAFVFSSKWRRSDVITDAEFTTIRYSGRGVSYLRFFKAIYYGTVINCVVLAMVLIAATRIASVFLPWHEWLPTDFYLGMESAVSSLGLNIGMDSIQETTNNLLSIFLILGFTTLYSTTGGLRSVVDTDVAQFAVAMIGTAAYAGVILYHTGGLSGMLSKIETQFGAERAGELLSFSPPGDEMLLSFFLIISLQWFFQMNSDGTGYLAQRMMACEDDKGARFSGILFTWLQIFLRSLIWVVIGVGLLALYPYAPEDVTKEGFVAGRELLFITGIRDLMPIGFKGLILTGLLGALSSTVDTHLNWGSSYWSNDIYQDMVCKHWLKRQPSSKELVWVARLSNLIILSIGIVIMFNLDSIQEAWKLSLLFGAGMGPVLVLRWLWERVNLFSELTAMITSLVAAPLILSFIETGWMHLPMMALATTALTIIVTLLTPSTDEATLTSFYKRVHPSGFWMKTAGTSEPWKRFTGQIQGVIVACLSLFLTLVGAGRLLLTPGRDLSVLGSLGLLLGGLLLIPVWWKYLHVKEDLVNR